jgi:hypothetical protein
MSAINARITGGLAACVLALIGLPAAAAATSSPAPGVHVDPGSPVAKQYSIPLATARGAPPGSSTPTTLFGQGISQSPASSGTPQPTRAAAPTRQGAQKRGGSQRRPPAAHRRTRSGQNAAQPIAPPPALKVLHPGSGSATIWMIGLAAMVIVLGGAGGLLVSSRMRRHSPRAG